MAQDTTLAVNAIKASGMLGVGRTKLLQLAYSGAIPSVKVGRSRLFLVTDLERWAQDQVQKNSAGLGA